MPPIHPLKYFALQILEKKFIVFNGFSHPSKIKINIFFFSYEFCRPTLIVSTPENLELLS